MSYISNKLLIKSRSFVLWHTERTVDKIKRRMPAPKPFWILINPHIRILIHLPQISNIAFQSKLYVTNIQGGIIMEAVVMYKYIHNEGITRSEIYMLIELIGLLFSLKSRVCSGAHAHQRLKGRESGERGTGQQTGFLANRKWSSWMKQSDFEKHFYITRTTITWNSQHSSYLSKAYRQTNRHTRIRFKPQ